MLDLVVIGGGPAGLATALAARQRGLSVVVVEARLPPVDKACGEGVMPRGVAALAELGVTLEDAPGRAFTGIRYMSGDTVLEADFPDGATGRGVRRTTLHSTLVEHAVAAGAELLFGERVESLIQNGVRLEQGAEIRARFVAGADGLLSKVREWGGFALPSPGRPRFGVRRHVALEPEVDRVEVIFGDQAEAYLTPVGAGEMGVALLWSGAAKGFDDLVESRFPPLLAERLAGAAVLSRDRGAGPFRQRLRSISRGYLALVGDAAGYVDALTGEGMAVAFQEALALARAIDRGSLRGYGREAARLRRVPEAMTRLTVWMARRSGMRQRVVDAFAMDPALFGRVLGVLGCGRPLRELGPLAVARFLGRILIYG